MTPRQILSAALLALPLSAAASATTLLVANKSDHTVDLIEVASGRVVARLATDRAPHEVAVSPDGALAAVSNYGDRDGPGSTLTVVDVARAEVARRIDLGPHSRPHGLAWISPRELAVTAEGSGHLLVVDAVSGEVRRAQARRRRHRRGRRGARHHPRRRRGLGLQPGRRHLDRPRRRQPRGPGHLALPWLPDPRRDHSGRHEGPGLGCAQRRGRALRHRDATRAGARQAGPGNRP